MVSLDCCSKQQQQLQTNKQKSISKIHKIAKHKIFILFKKFPTQACV